MGDVERLEGVDAEGWQAECEAVALGIATMLLDAGRHPAQSAVLEMLRGVPCGGKDLGDLPKDSLFYRVAMEGVGNRAGPPRTDAIARLVEMPEPRRSLLVASVVGTLLGMGMSR